MVRAAPHKAKYYEATQCEAWAEPQVILSGPVRAVCAWAEPQVILSGPVRAVCAPEHLHERAVRALVAVRAGVVVNAFVGKRGVLELREQGLAEAVRLAQVQRTKVKEEVPVHPGGERNSTARRQCVTIHE